MCCSRFWVCLRVRVCVCVRLCVGRGTPPLPPLLPPSLNTPGSRASTASAAAVLSSSSSSSRPRHHKSLSSSNHPCPSDLHAPRPRQVSHSLFLSDTLTHTLLGRHTHTLSAPSVPFSTHHFTQHRLSSFPQWTKTKERDEEGIK